MNDRLAVASDGSLELWNGLARGLRQSCAQVQRLDAMMKQFDGAARSDSRGEADPDKSVLSSGIDI